VARVPDIKRIKKEDFNSDQQDWVEKLAFPLNSFMEQVRSAFQKKIDFTNLNQELITISLIVDASGFPITTTKYKSNLSTNVAGHTVLGHVNRTDSTVMVTGAPYLTFTESGGIVQILHVTGLPANNKFDLTVLSIGK
jgi:hypothetical protein